MHARRDGVGCVDFSQDIRRKSLSCRLRHVDRAQSEVDAGETSGDLPRAHMTRQVSGQVQLVQLVVDVSGVLGGFRRVFCCDVATETTGATREPPAEKNQVADQYIVLIPGFVGFPVKQPSNVDAVQQLSNQVPAERREQVEPRGRQRSTERLQTVLQVRACGCVVSLKNRDTKYHYTKLSQKWKKDR